MTQKLPNKKERKTEIKYVKQKMEDKLEIKP